MRITIVAAVAMLACAGPTAGLAAGTADTAPPNAPDQKPAFPGQTRAPLPAQPTAVAITTAVEGIQGGWGFEFMPDGRMLVTEKSGRLRIVANGRPGSPVAGVPAVDSRGQGGLLDVALSPGFPQDRLVYLSFSEPRQGGGNGTSVARARLVEENGQARLDNVDIVFRQMPTWDNNMHFGSRLVFAPDGKLFITVGERSDREPRVQAQRLSSGLGKVFRINPDGTIPPDNPFVGKGDAQPAIWSLGHRNTQSASLDTSGRLWIVEHGPRGGDELNRPEPGKNYGWPEVTYGVEYGGQPLGVTQREGTEQPVYYWDPVIAPSGMAAYDGALFPNWRGALIVGGLVSQGLVVLRMENDRVASEERVSVGSRTRDVKVGPDGAVYALTETRGGGPSRIVRVAPK